MATRAEIDARKAAIAAVKNGHNTFAGAFNTGAQALTPLAADFQPLIVALNKAAVAHNDSISLITGAESLWNAAVPSDPIPPATTSPDNTFGDTITDNLLHVWTFGPADFSVDRPTIKQTLRDGVHVAGGYATNYLWWHGNTYCMQPDTPSAWFLWNGTLWVQTFIDPRATSIGPTKRIYAVSGGTITDDSNRVWSFGPLGSPGTWEAANPLIYVNGASLAFNGDQILWALGSIWVHNTLGAWRQYTASGFVAWGLNDPTGTEAFAQTVITPPAQVPAAGCVRAAYTEAQLASGAGPAGLVYFAMEQAKLPTYPLTNYYTSHTSEYRIFPQYPGVTFARQFSDGTNPDGSTYPSLTMCSWSYFFPDVDEIWVNWPVMLDPDLKNGLQENGVKLNMVASTEAAYDLSSLAFVRKSDRLTIPARYPLAVYNYRVGVAQLLEDISNEYLYEGVFHTLDMRLKMNTPGVANGELELWVDDKLKRLSTDIIFRDSSTIHFNQTELLLYQGGQSDFPLRNTHIWIGPYTVTTPAIGRAGMLREAALPSWRDGMPLNQFSPIPGTAPSAATGMPLEWGAEVINGYNGLQTDEKRGVIYSGAAGGHAETLQNGVYKIDIMQAQPRWSTVRASSNVSSHPVDVFYLPDGTPIARHTYYAGQVVDIAGSPVIIFAGMMAGQSSQGAMNSMQTDAFHVNGATWAPAGTWPDMPGAIGSIFAKCVAKDPRTQRIWAIDGSAGGLLSYLDTGAKTWTPFNGNLNNWGMSGGALIDTKRNRFVIAGSASYVSNPGTPQAAHDPIALGMANLTTGAYQDMGLTGSKPAFNGEMGFIYDTAKDRYIVIEGVTGRVTAINPDTGECTLLTTTVPAALGHVESRCAYIPDLKGVVYLPSWDSDILFMPLA